MKKAMGLMLVCGCFSIHGAEYYALASRPDDSGDGTSWGTAKKTIQSAVDLATDGDTVWVGSGTYNQGGKVCHPYSIIDQFFVTNRVCITNDITVRASSSNPADTIIQGAPGTGGGTAMDAVRGVFMTNGFLTGFTVTGGYTGNSTADEVNLYRDLSGGGALLEGANCVISNCVFTANQAAEYGGAIHIINAGKVVNCTIENNDAGARGGGVRLTAGGEISDCTISGNTAGGFGGGIQAYNGGSANRCVISGNSATGTQGSGGGIYGNANNCLIYNNNAASMGGGASSGTLRNCTIYGNNATTYYGGCYNVVLRNCIAWGNTSWNDSQCSGSASYYSCSPDGVTHGVNGCITNNPLFLGAPGNLRIGTNSPCLNAGANVFAPAGPDLNGNTRIAGLIVDMGAYEEQSGVTPPDIHWSPEEINLSVNLQAELSDTVGLIISNGGVSELTFSLSGGTATSETSWAQAGDPNAPVFDWIDITSDYTGKFILGDAGESPPLNIGFEFPFYGTVYTQLQIAADGGLLFDFGDLASANTALPAATNSVPGAALLPFWDDLYDLLEGGGYYYKSESNRFIVTFHEIPRTVDLVEHPNTFQSVLYSDGRILFQYLDMQGAVDNCTVGVQAGPSGSALQMAYDNAFVTNGLALMVFPPQDWLSYDPVDGALPAYGETSIVFSADASKVFQTGIYETAISITHNDPFKGTINLPVTFTVTDEGGDPNDTDADGLPDTWEMQYYGNLSANPGDAAANGLNTIWESYIAGLNPTNPASMLALSNLQNVVWWSAASSRVYRVWWSSNLLAAPFTLLQSNLTTGVFTDTVHGADSKGFYKLDVHLEP